MIDPGLFVKGVVVGLMIAAPVGPIGVLCVRRTLLLGPVVGLYSGLGAAVADAAYGTVAAFGLSVISDFLITHNTWLRLIGGGFLCYLGIRTFARAQARKTASGESGPIGTTALVGAFGSTLALTLTNPATVLSFLAVFAGIGIATKGIGVIGASTLVTGVFLGSTVWWLGLSAGVGALRHRVGPHFLMWINRVSGILILGFGIVAIVSGAYLFNHP